MKKRPKLLTLLALTTLSLLTACNPPQPLNFSVQNVQPSSVQVDGDLRGVTVTPAAPNERTGELPPAVAAITGTWKEATEEALARAALFNDESHRRLSLEIKVLKLNAPALGITFPTDTDAKYTLLDRQTGAVVFSQIISSQGTTPLGFAFVGAIRARESINRSVQNNILGFVQALEASPIAIKRLNEPSS